MKKIRYILFFDSDNVDQNNFVYDKILKIVVIIFTSCIREKLDLIIFYLQHRSYIYIVLSLEMCEFSWDTLYNIIMCIRVLNNYNLFSQHSMCNKVN